MTEIKSIELELYEMLINNKGSKAEHWDNMSLVFSKSGKSCFGFIFFENGWAGFTPSSFEWLSPANFLTMQWKQKVSHGSKCSRPLTRKRTLTQLNMNTRINPDGSSAGKT